MVNICFVECKHIFLHKGRKQNISEKDGEYWMLTIKLCANNLVVVAGTNGCALQVC